VDTATLIVTTIGGALSATLGVVVGGLVTRHSQQRHSLRDKQLQAYDDLFAQYSRFMILLNRSHLGRQHVDIDWAAWSAALTSASLVAPLAGARAIDGFGTDSGGGPSGAAERDQAVDGPLAGTVDVLPRRHAGPPSGGIR
jgi:hypothetical protein